MIIAYVNKDGYYIVGQEVECCRKMSPALDQEGNQIFSNSLHLYKVLETLLKEDCFSSQGQREEVIIYNDSRLIDEINGNIHPLIVENRAYRDHLRRNIIPLAKGIIFFRKCSAQFLNSMISKGQSKMLNKISDEQKINMINKTIHARKASIDSKRKSVLAKFKERLYDGTQK
jgi:hypothetical protein